MILFFAMTSCQSPDNRKQPDADVSQTDTSRKVLPVKNMQEDLSILWGSIQEIHPAYGFVHA